MTRLYLSLHGNAVFMHTVTLLWRYVHRWACIYEQEFTFTAKEQVTDHTSDHTERTDTSVSTAVRLFNTSQRKVNFPSVWSWKFIVSCLKSSKKWINNPLMVKLHFQAQVNTGSAMQWVSSALKVCNRFLKKNKLKKWNTILYVKRNTKYIKIENGKHVWIFYTLYLSITIWIDMNITHLLWFMLSHGEPCLLWAFT